MVSKWFELGIRQFWCKFTGTCLCVVTYMLDFVWLLHVALVYFALFYCSTLIFIGMCAFIFISCVSLVRAQAGSGEDAGETDNCRECCGELCERATGSGSGEFCRGALAGTGALVGIGLASLSRVLPEGSVKSGRDKGGPNACKKARLQTSIRACEKEQERPQWRGLSEYFFWWGSMSGSSPAAKTTFEDPLNPPFSNPPPSLLKNPFTFSEARFLLLCEARAFEWIWHEWRRGWRGEGGVGKRGGRGSCSLMGQKIPPMRILRGERMLRSVLVKRVESGDSLPA